MIHPEDLPFVIEAERVVIEKMREIGWEHVLSLKKGYCFRMKRGNGDYQLFHHQSLRIKNDESGRIIQTINIHTNIQHITPINSHIVTLIGIGSRSDFHQVSLKLELKRQFSLQKDYLKEN